MKKKTICIALTGVGAIVCMVVLLSLLYIKTQELDAAQTKIAELRLQKDEQLITEQVEALTEDNSILREKLAAYEQSTNAGNNTAAKCAERLVRGYYERKYDEYNAKEYFDALKEFVKDNCTENGFLSFFPEEAEASASPSAPMPVGEAFGGGLEIADEVFRDSIWYLISYSQVQNDGSVNVFIAFIRDSDHDYIGHIIESNRTENLFNAKMVYSEDKGTWLCDEVYLNTTVFGADFTEMR